MDFLVYWMEKLSCDCQWKLPYKVNKEDVLWFSKQNVPITYSEEKDSEATYVQF